MTVNEIIASEFKVKLEYVDNIIGFIDDGKTIPFIARYRKEFHGSMDDQKIREISERLTYLRNLNARKEEIISLIDQQGKLTDELKSSIERASAMVELEDIYRPYRPKRKTRASVAKEKGLEPLAMLILMQNPKTEPEKEAEKFISEEKGVASCEEAIAGACDIIAEQISDNAELRKRQPAKVRKNILRRRALNAAA